jgi:ABC-type multidrug transport system fused ATPase/permease subunit
LNEKLNILGGVRALSKYIKKYRLNFILFYIGWLFDSILTVITPIIFSIMIDEIVYYKNIHVFLRVSVVFVIMSIFSCILYFFIYAQHHYLMIMYSFDIKLDVFKKMQSMKASYMSNAKTGDIIATLLGDTGDCIHFVIRNVIHLINSILRGIFYIVYIYIISVHAGLLVTIFLPFAAYSTFKFSKKIRTQTDTQRELYGGYVSWLFEILKGLADIRLLCAQNVIRKEFTSHLRKLFKINIKTSVSNLSSDKMIELINLLMQLSIYGVCAYLAFKSKITIGNVMVLVAFVFTLKDDTILHLARNLMDAQTRLTRIARIKRFLAEEDESSWIGTKKLVINKGNIEFRNIHFSYDSRKPVLQNFSDFIPAGSHIAIIGKSGCGKTTLASLLIGMYEANAGEIYIDGENLTEFNLKSIRENIGIVQQEVLVFDGTIRDNLLLGNPRAKEQELWEACRKAGIAEHFESLPEKLDTLIGKAGISLSGGQRQRLAIARIYLKSPSIIIFDEATSALDSETEKIIHEAWRELLQGRTAIVIAHRLSSVMLCDRAILMENGTVVASGAPKELMENDESFRELFALKEVLENV